MATGRTKMWLECRCGHEGTLDWDMSRSTLREDVLPNARCARCGHVGAVDMRVYWEATSFAMERSRVPVERQSSEGFVEEEEF